MTEDSAYPDEFVRHKMLDCIGDFSLIGMPIMGPCGGQQIRTRL
jgi:UDP-3-O-acyl-N-acetylglucosamine deacetylase